MDGTRLNDVGNQLAAFLQKRFSNYDIVINRDKDFKDKLTAIGFIVPLDSLSQWVMSDLIGNKKQTKVTDDTEETKPGEE